MHYPGTGSLSFYGITSETNFFYGRAVNTEGPAPVYAAGWYLFIMAIGF